MFGTAVTMIKDSAGAFVKRNLNAIKDLNTMEEAVDDYFCKIRAVN